MSELVAETLRAALNELATIVPDWVRQIALLDWYKRYERRIEDTRLPETAAERDAYGQTKYRERKPVFLVSRL